MENENRPLQARVGQIWREILGRPIDDNAEFFAVGGHSIQLIKLLVRISDEFKIGISIETFLERPTIAGLSATLHERLER